MTPTILARLLPLAVCLAPWPALAEPGPAASGAAPAPTTPAVPAQLDAAQRDGYRAVFAALRAGRWTDAQIGLDAMPPGPLHPIARAELYLAKGSPRVEADALLAVLTAAPELPEGAELARLATARGAVALPPLPVAQSLVWRDGAPRRVHARATASDQVAADLATAMQPLVKGDRAVEAQGLLETTVGLSPEVSTEWQHKVAWMYFLSGDDANARAMAARAASGSGEWANQARWVGALAAWRSRDWAAAESGFVDVAARAGNTDLRAAAFYWAARAAFAGGHPERVQQRLTVAAQAGDSFYGQLARQGLLLRTPAPVASGPVAGDWAALANRPNVRVAAALTEIDETDLADRVVRQQARIGAPAEFSHLVHLAEALDLPATTVWLAHNSPAGVAPAAEARFPTPNWAPDKGWRVERALVYAHTLEESGFRQKATSRAGAFGLMQIMPSAATDFARENGATVASTDWRAALARPSLNMEVGQRHLERLRDMTSITGGLLPKVIAAYNAGPKPVADWNTSVRDGGDPLLYIESIPYWETRGYVTTVLRNYWMYEAKSGRATLPSRSALAQGMWPRFPGLPGTSAVRLDARPSAAAIAVNAPIDPRTGAAIRSE